MGDSNGCGLVGSKSKGAGVTTALATAVATAAARVAGAGMGDSGGRQRWLQLGGQYPHVARSLRCPRTPAANNDDKDKFANVGGQGGGQGRWPGDRRWDDHQSAIRPCCNMSGTPLRRGRKWNGQNFKQLGKVRVIIFKNTFAIVVPVDLSCYIFGRRWCSHL